MDAFLQSSSFSMTAVVSSIFSTSLRHWYSISFACAFLIFATIGEGSTTSSHIFKMSFDSHICPKVQYVGMSSTSSAILFFFCCFLWQSRYCVCGFVIPFLPTEELEIDSVSLCLRWTRLLVDFFKSNIYFSAWRSVLVMKREPSRQDLSIKTAHTTAKIIVLRVTSTFCVTEWPWSVNNGLQYFIFCSCSERHLTWTLYASVSMKNWPFDHGSTNTDCALNFSLKLTTTFIFSLLRFNWEDSPFFFFQFLVWGGAIFALLEQNGNDSYIIQVMIAALVPSSDIVQL